MSVHVSREEWEAIAEEDKARRAAHKEYDMRGSMLTAASGILILLMLVIGPMWTLIAVVGGPDEHGPTFDSWWWMTTILALLAAIPLGFAIRRERNPGRWWLVGLLAGSLAVQLATYPW